MPAVLPVSPTTGNLAYTGAMFSPKLAELLTTQERTSRIIWFAMCMAILLYGAVLVMIALDQSQSGEPGDTSVMLPILAGMSVVTAIGTLMFKRHVFSDDALRAALSASPADVSALPGVDDLEADEQRVLAVVMSRHTMSIIVLALQESIAIYGLVLGFIARDPVMFAPFGAVALVLHLFEFPRTQILAERVQKLALTTVVTG